MMDKMKSHPEILFHLEIKWGGGFFQFHVVLLVVMFRVTSSAFP